MLQRLKDAASPAMLVAVMALVLACAGSAVAASRLIDGSQIRRHSIPANRLADGALKGLRGERGPRGARGAHGKAGKAGKTGKTGTRGQQGPKGITGPRGPQGPKGDTGATGPQGPQGPAGESGVVTITASTEVSDWPEGSGWATDEFTRKLTLTRNYPVPSDDCEGTPTCWFYTGTLVDDGHFTTVAGHAAPNPTIGGTITGSFTGTMKGEATFEFYASSDSPDAGLVPPDKATKSGGVSTSGWAQLAFPPDTTFVNSSAGGPLTAYQWVYSAGCDEQTWTDGINPGDDGQGPSDGNITGPCS